MRETAEGTAALCQPDEELADVLTAISVVAKRLARRLRTGTEKGGSQDGQNERSGPAH